MKITALVENNAQKPLSPVHGLSLYIETTNHKLLFDVGVKGAIFQNAPQLGVDLTAVDTVILSHGHYDHGGDLLDFLALNKTAKVYIQRDAFGDFFAHHLLVKKKIGIDRTLMHHPQVTLLDGDHTIDDELHIFKAERRDLFPSTANANLFCGDRNDTFTHEQNLIVHDAGHTALIMGCGHSGVVNILDKAQQWSPELCVGGFHLNNPTANVTVSDALMDDIAAVLAPLPIHFYTCHCTGEYAFHYLEKKLPAIDYLACGGEITL